MREVILKPVKETTEDFEDIEDEILAVWREEIYLPLIRELKAPKSKLENSMDDLISAISSGKIRFYRGQFTGRFNAATSRELKRLGAKWDRKQGSWKIPLGSLPTDVRLAISLSEDRFVRFVRKLDEMLEKILPEKIAEKMKLEKFFDTALFKTDESIKQTLKGITVTPKLTKEQRAEIAEGYTKDLKRYIKDWTEKEIGRLRKKVEKSTLAGNRYEGLIKDIQSSYQVSRNKAKFLARQETSLMMAEFKKTRYVAAGSDEYIWGCVAGSPNHPVRPMHKKLEGKKFRWDDPPITDENGKRNHPGQDYNCRCFARPVVKF